MNLLGIVTGQNGALVLKIVRQSTIKVEALCQPFVMAALVLQFFGSRKLHCGGAIITTIGAGGVTRYMGSGWGCLGRRWAGIIGAVRERSVGLDSVVTFLAQLYKFVEILGLIGLLNEDGLEFLGEPSFETGLLRLGVVIENYH
jgi:hypothetical protein